MELEQMELEQMTIEQIVIEQMSYAPSNVCMSYSILKNNSADYHDDVYFIAICKLWNCVKKIF